MWRSSIKSLLRANGLRSLFTQNARRGLWPGALACLAALTAVLLIALLAVRPAVARLDRALAAHRELKRQNAEALLFLKQKKDIAGIAAGIPSQKDVPLLIKDIVQTARKLNLAVGAIDSDIPAPGKGGMAPLTFTVPVSGAYPDVKRFIYKMETTELLVGVQGIDLKAEKNAVRLQLKLVTYIKNE